LVIAALAYISFVNKTNSVAALYPKQHRWSFLFAGLKTAPTKDLRQFGRWKSFEKGTILGIKKYFNKSNRERGKK
jgi:hypothetical protein